MGETWGARGSSRKRPQVRRGFSPPPRPRGTGLTFKWPTSGSEGERTLLTWGPFLIEWDSACPSPFHFAASLLPQLPVTPPFNLFPHWVLGPFHEAPVVRSPVPALLCTGQALGARSSCTDPPGFQSVLLRLEPSFAQSLVYASEKWGQVSLLGGSCGILKKNDKSGLPILTAWMQPLIYSHSSITSLTSITHPLLHLLNYLFTYSLIHTTFSPIPRQPRNDIRGPQLFGGHQAGAHRTAGGDNPKVLRWK